MNGKRNLAEVAFVSLKLGCIGFGGIAGMVGLMEHELVDKRRWITTEEYLDVVGAANIIPGPNSVEIVMHCGQARAGRAGLVLSGILYILPATLICLLWAWLYTRYGHLPSVQPFLYGIVPATVAIITGATIRLAKSAFKSRLIIVLSLVVLAGALYGINEVILLFAAGVFGVLFLERGRLYSLTPLPVIVYQQTEVSYSKLFFIFLKIGAILYGSGYVLYAYLHEALVQRNHWLTQQQLIDAISVGQITPGPILSSATFAGYLISGPAGALLASIGIFLPSFFFAFFLQRLLRFINRHATLRNFLDIVNGASVALIAAVAIHLLPDVVTRWQTSAILIVALLGTLKKVNTAWIILFGSICGWVIV